MPDTSHLVALQIGLAHERARLASARSEPERASRAVWVAQREREIAGEFAFLGMDSAPPIVAMSDAELLAELLS